jgi:hypothetical protein
MNHAARKFSIVLTVMACLGSARVAQANSITFDGVLGSGVTATVSNDSLVGNLFSFTLRNTSQVGGIITNIALDKGDSLSLTGFTTNAGISYSSFDDPASAPELPPTHVIDFALFPPNQSIGIAAGQSFLFTWTLAPEPVPFVGMTADSIGDAMSLRFRLVPTSESGADIAVPTPEPASLMLVGTGVLGIVRRRRVRHSR